MIIDSDESDEVRIEWAEFHAAAESVNGIGRDDLIRIDSGSVSGLFTVSDIGPEQIHDGRLCRYVQAFRYVRKKDSIVARRCRQDRIGDISPRYSEWPDEIE